MDLTNIFDIYNIFQNDSFAFVYRGIFTNNILNLTTDLIQSMEEFRQVGIQNKLSYLTIEAFQNVIRYSETSRMSREQSDLFIFRRLMNDFFITTVNLINKRKARQMEAYLRELNSLSFEQLKQLYLEILTNQSFTEKGGAGLGLIEMIRKSKNRLKYQFVPFNTEYEYFYFQIQLNLQQVSKYELPLSQSVEINQISRKLNALLIQKANFSNKTIRPVINIINQNIRQSLRIKEMKRQRRVFGILVELLQDLAEYTALLREKREAVLVFGRNLKKFYILVGSLIEHEKYAAKKQIIDYYKDKTAEQLTQDYYKYLSDDQADESVLRTIKILLLGSNYKYLDTPFDDKYTFFTQMVEIDA